VSHLRLLIGLLAVSAFAADPALDDFLKGVESRYNQAKTLQVLFKEDYTPPGRMRHTDSGILMQRKPGRMRWDYSEPKGKLFVGDGKNLWIYTPADNRVERMPVKASEDMRAPLAFLLGKLNFQKDFSNLKAVKDGADTRITADPKSDSLPYSQVEFVVASDHRIRRVKLTGTDKAVLDFTFDQEKLNPKLDDNLFRFPVPPGAEVVEGGQ
jgi:outer membrane lipoprotein carrier protein